MENQLRRVPCEMSGRIGPGSFNRPRKESQALWQSIAQSISTSSQALVAGAISEEEAAEATQHFKVVFQHKGPSMEGADETRNCRRFSI